MKTQTQVELKTAAHNLAVRPQLLKNSWVIPNDFVFVFTGSRFKVRDNDGKYARTKDGKVQTALYRTRRVVPANSVHFDTPPKPRFVRAEIVKAALLFGRKHRGVRARRSEIDAAYCNVLRQDGIGAFSCFKIRAGLYLKGVATRLWTYWTLPNAKGIMENTPSDDVRSTAVLHGGDRPRSADR